MENIRDLVSKGVEIEFGMFSPKILADKYEVNGHRWYYERDTDYLNPRPSVTTILNAQAPALSFKTWLRHNETWYTDEFSQYTREVGNYAHALCMHLNYGLEVEFNQSFIERSLPTKEDPNGEIPLSNEPIPLDDKMVIDIKKCINNYIKWVSSEKPQILASELTLYAPALSWAGQADLVCVIDGELWLIDIKTGSPRKRHRHQVTLYKKLFEYIYQVEIDHIGCLHINSKRKSAKLEEYQYGPVEADHIYGTYVACLNDGDFPIFQETF